MMCRAAAAATDADADAGDGATIPRLFLCAVCSSFYATSCKAYSFTTYGYGIFNKRANYSLGTCSTHEERGTPRFAFSHFAFSRFAFSRFA